MPTQFIRIGDRLINLGLVVHVNLRFGREGNAVSVKSAAYDPGESDFLTEVFVGQEADKLRTFFNTQCNADDPMAGVAHVHVI